MSDTDEAWDAKFKRERQEEMELAVRLNREAHDAITAEAREYETGLYAERHALEHADALERIARINENEQTRDEVAASRDREREARWEAFNNARDRRVVWMCAIQGALGNNTVPNSKHAADVADGALEEYDKRWAAP